MKFHKILLSIGLLFTLLACTSEPETGPVKVNFDRDACERCRMLLSDRFHAAQIRGGERNQVFKFDDVGGAVIWLAEQSWKDEEKTEIWVTDHNTGDWIDAKKSWYVREKHTPMNYGYSAEPVKRDTAIDYQAMVDGVMAIEEKYKNE